MTNTGRGLLTLDNVVCTPHIGYVWRDGFEGQCCEIFDQILAYADGKPINGVNPGVLAGGTRLPPSHSDLA